MVTGWLRVPKVAPTWQGAVRLVLTTAPHPQQARQERTVSLSFCFGIWGCYPSLESRGTYNWDTSDTEERLLVSESSRMRGATVLGIGLWFLSPSLLTIWELGSEPVL